MWSSCQTGMSQQQQQQPYKAIPQHEVLVAQEYNGPIYGSTTPTAYGEAVPIPAPEAHYYGAWREEPVEVMHRGDDLDLYCSLFIVFFFFFFFICLIIVVSIEYADDDYYR